MTVEKPKPKQLLRPITSGAGSAMNQSQFLAITCNSLEAREKSRVRGAVGFGFDSHWLKNWRESFKPITKRSNRCHVITFDSHLKTALMTKMTMIKTTTATVTVMMMTTITITMVIIIFLFQVTYDPQIQARTVTLGGDLFDPQGTATGGKPLF